VPSIQAEAEADALGEALAAQAQAVSHLDSQFKTLAADVKRDAENTATKTDIALVRKDMELRATQLDAKIDLMRKDMEALENRLVTRLTKAMLAVMGLALAIIGSVAAIARLLA